MPALTAHSLNGRILLALRAGPMASEDLQERFGFGPSTIARQGLVELRDGVYRLTDAGRAACPLRNPLAAAVSPPPVPAPNAHRVQFNVLPPRKRINPMDHKKERRKPLRPAALAAIAGIDEAHALRRSEWIQRIPDGEDDNSMSHVIQKLVKESVVGAYGRTDQRRYYDLRTASPTTAPPDAPAPPAPTHRKREREEVNAAPGAPAGSGACHFAVHDDLSLSISDGTSVLILPPEDVRRMTRFLNLFAPCQ